MKIDLKNKNANVKASIIFKTVIPKIISKSIYRDLQDRCLWEDIEITVYTIAWETRDWKADKEFLRYAGRCIYKAMTELGYKRSRHWRGWRYVYTSLLHGEIDEFKKIPKGDGIYGC